MATSSAPHSVSGGATSRAGSMTCSEPQTAARWAAVAAVPERPAAANNPLPTAAATSPSFVLTSPPAYSGAPGLLGVLALGELLDDLRAEDRQVVGVTARDQALVGDNLLVHPGAPGVADFCLEGRVGGQRAAPHHVRFDEGPWAVADHADRLGSFEEGAHESNRLAAAAEVVRPHGAARHDQGVVVLR